MGFFIIGMLVWGLAAGWIAQLILGKGRTQATENWTLALVAGVGGSFVGGVLASLLAGEGLALRPSGIIGSVVGALIILAIWYVYQRRSAA